MIDNAGLYGAKNESSNRISSVYSLHIGDAGSMAIRFAPKKKQAPIPPKPKKAKGKRK